MKQHLEVIGEVDIVIFVIDATSLEIGKGDKIILEKLNKQIEKQFY